MSAYADQNHAPDLTYVRLAFSHRVVFTTFFLCDRRWCSQSAAMHYLFLRYSSLITCSKADIRNPLSLLDHACMRIFLFLLAHFHFFFRRMSVHTDHAAFLQRSYKKICKDTSYYCGNKKWHNVYKQTSRI